MTIRVLIVDDEAPARDRVRAMLASHPECELIGEAGDGASAVDAIVRDRPDLVFLDIRMPELDGFEVAAAADEESGVEPAIVFTTAHDSYAVAAFEIGAFDYLLKPFDQARFDRALITAMERIAARQLRGNDSSGRLAELLRSLGAIGDRPSRFLVRRGRQMEFVRADDVDWLDAQGNYVRLHVGGRAHLLRETMTAIDGKLDPARFIRVHRSAIVNIDRIARIEPHLHGEYLITMKDGNQLTTSAAHSGRLRDLLR